MKKTIAFLLYALLQHLPQTSDTRNAKQIYKTALTRIKKLSLVEHPLNKIGPRLSGSKMQK
jgi:hypothetical protein